MTGIHGGAARGAAAAAIGTALVLAAGAPAAEGTLVPVPTVPATPPGGLIEPPLGVVLPPEPVPTAESPAPAEPVPVSTAPASAAGPGPSAGSAPYPGAPGPAVPAATSAAAVARPADDAPAAEGRTVDSAAGRSDATSKRVHDRPAAAHPNIVLVGFGLGLLSVAAAAAVLYARLRGA